VSAHTLIVTLRNCTVKLAGEKSRAAWEQDVRSADKMSARLKAEFTFSRAARDARRK